MNPRALRGDALLAAMDTARRATLAAALDLTDEQWAVPYDPGVQPTAWDLAHIGWFAEFWLLRGPHGTDPDGAVTAGSTVGEFADDAHYDSARIAHRTRWELPLLPRQELVQRLARQLERCQQHVAARADDAATVYHAHFAVYHELMHWEALHWTRDLLAYPPPAGAAMRTFAERGEVALAGGHRELGTARGGPEFAFDNEQPQRSVELPPFRIDRAPVTNGQFLQFVEQDGYARAEFWPGPAARWLHKAARRCPARWRHRDGAWQQRWFDAWRPLPLDEPVVHVSAFEAEAFCRFAGRRLPRAAEWEVAATAGQIVWGHSVWEWTADAFAPYPDFRPAPYSTYSAPWFHWQRELRGGAFATHALVHDHRYRNFFLPSRTDIFAGFRSAADA